MRREVLGVCFDKTGKKLASCSKDNTIRVWDPTTGEPIGSPLRGDKEVHCVSFSPDGDMLAAGDGDYQGGNVRLYDVQTGEVKSTLGGHSSDNPECTCQHFDEDGDEDYEAHPQCPVTGYVPAFPCSACSQSRGVCSLSSDEQAGLLRRV